MPSPLMIDMLLIVCAAVSGGFLSRLVRVPPVFGYIVGGIIFGSISTMIFGSGHTVVDLSLYILAILLYTLGLELSFKSFRIINKKLVLIGLVQVAFVALFLFPLILFFSSSAQVSLLLAVLFAFSSTSVVVKILEEKGKLTDFPGNHVLFFLVLQDFLVIGAFFLIPLLFSTTGISMDQFGNFLISIVKSVSIFVALYLFGKIILPKVLQVFHNYPSQELTILMTMLLSLVAIALFQITALPLPIAAFFAGILIGQEGTLANPLQTIRPVRDVLLVIFFVLVGMILDPMFLLSNIGYIVLFTIMVLLFKFSALYFTLRNTGYMNASASFVAVHLTNISEFSILIGYSALLQKGIGEDIYYTLLSVFTLSVLLTPLLVRKAVPLGKLLSSIKIFKNVFGEDANTLKQTNTEQFTNHVVLCGHGKIGIELRSLLDYAGIGYVVIDTNRTIIKQLNTENKFAIYGDPSDDKLLQLASIERARAVIILTEDFLSQKKITKSALSYNQNITVISKIQDESHKFDLANLGVNAIVVPEFEAGVRIGREVLEMFHVSDHNMTTLIKRLRREHFLR